MTERLSGGYKADSNMRAEELCIEAFGRRAARPTGLPDVLHSDRGTSTPVMHFRRLSRGWAIRYGERRCYDNARMEKFLRNTQKAIVWIRPNSGDAVQNNHFPSSTAITSNGYSTTRGCASEKKREQYYNTLLAA